MKDELLAAIKHAGLLPPKILNLSITNQCNQHCIHCWLESGSQPDAAHVPFEVIQRLIREFIELGLEGIILSGGEPLTHPAWLDILGVCFEHESLENICLQTNATLLTSVHIQHLMPFRDCRFFIQVSLDGVKPETHDVVRGKGNFERVMKGLRRLVDHGFEKHIRIAFTEMAHNFGDIPDLLKRIESLGIEHLVSHTLIRGGRASRAGQIDLPSPEQYKDLIDRYTVDSEFRFRYKRYGKIAMLEWYEGMNQPASRICRCIETPYIAANGKMYPCTMFQSKSVAIDGMHHRSIAEIFQEALPIWQKLPEVSRRRTSELEACKHCAGRLHCGGGCMGRADTAYGDVMNVEDRCTLRQTIYTWSDR